MTRAGGKMAILMSAFAFVMSVCVSCGLLFGKHKCELDVVNHLKEIPIEKFAKCTTVKELETLIAQEFSRRWPTCRWELDLRCKLCEISLDSSCIAWHAHAEQFARECENRFEPDEIPIAIENIPNMWRYLTLLEHLSKIQLATNGEKIVISPKIYKCVCHVVAIPSDYETKARQISRQGIINVGTMGYQIINNGRHIILFELAPPSWTNSVEVARCFVGESKRPNVISEDSLLQTNRGQADGSDSPQATNGMSR